MPDMKNKTFIPVQIKALADDGSFEGVLAVYNVKDLGGDLIEPGAFAKTIQERGGTVPMLWQHDSTRPIGTLTLIDSPQGLMVKGQLLMDLPDAKIAFTLIKAKVIKGLSIGYDTIKDSVENGVRKLKELRLWEGSIVTFPMNEMAMITAVKHAGAIETKGDFAEEMTVIQLQDVGYQMRAALFQSLGSIIWGAGLTVEDKVAAAQSTIDQFAAAFMAYLPQYLAWLAAEYGDMQLMSRLHMEEKTLGSLLGRGTKSLPTLRWLETKEGRKFSADTKKTLKKANEHVKGLSDIFGSLFADEADDDTDTSDDSSETDDDTDKAKVVTEEKTVEAAAAESDAAIAETLAKMRAIIAPKKEDGAQ
jgi:uncharacterized protein